MGKIGENFTFVGQVMGKNEVTLGEGQGLKVKLKEKDGKEFDWTSFHPSDFNDVHIRDYIEIECSFSENPKGKWPYKNIEKLIGPSTQAEHSNAPRANPEGVMSAPPQTGQSGASGPQFNGRGESPERSNSIERQSSVNAAAKVCEIIAGHYPEYFTDLAQVLSHAEENLPQFLKIAESIFNYYGDRAATASPQPTQPALLTNGSAPANTERAAGRSEPSESIPQEGPYEPAKLENVGHLLTAALKRWNHNKETICNFFGVGSPAEIPNSYTMSKAWEALKVHYDGPEGSK